MPSVAPATPEPASVVTAPVAITILRILWLFQSATYRLVPSVVMLEGQLKDAAFPTPSTAPVAPDPANVLTAVVKLSGAPCMAPPISCFTRTLAALEVMAPLRALMFVEPKLEVDAKPVPLIVATAVLLDAHVTIFETFAVVPSV